MYHLPQKLYRGWGHYRMGKGTAFILYSFYSEEVSCYQPRLMILIHLSALARPYGKF